MLRPVVVGVAVSGLALALLALLVPAALAGPITAPSLPGASGASFEDLLVRLLAALGAVGVGRVWWIGSLAVLDAARVRPGAPVSRPGRDGAVRRWVLLACGVAVTGPLLLGPAHAVQPPEPAEVASRLAGLPLPDRAAEPLASSGPAQTAGRLVERPVEASSHDPGSHAAWSGARSASVVVRPGDSLWSIAERTLPPGAGSADVDRRWRELWRLNRDLVGPDPDLIHPHQRLALPDADREDRP